MRLVLSFAFFAAAAPAFAAPVYDAPDDVASVIRVEKQNAVDFNLNRLMSGYAPDAVVYDTTGPTIFKGHDQVLGDFKAGEAGITSVWASFPSITVFSDGTMACAATQMSFNVTRTGGVKSQLNMRQLDVLRKVNGKWLVLQEHISFPTDPKSGRSLIDAPQTPAAALSFTENPFAGPPVAPDLAAGQIKDWVTAFATTPTVDGVLNLMGPGDQALIFDMFAPAPLQGQKAILAAYTPGFAQLAGASVSYVDFGAVSDGYIGGEIDTQSLRMKMKNGTAQSWKLRESDCLHQVGGRWYSVFDEVSFPPDWKTGKAIMN